MANSCKFYKQQRFVSYDSGATWQPLNEYRKGAFIEANSVDCGGGTIMYRWFPSGYTCVGYDKWELSVYQQSTDNGTSWTNVSGVSPSATTLIETNSVDCGYIPPTPIEEWRLVQNDWYCEDCDTPPTPPIYRWVDMDSSITWWCDGYDKYVRQKKQQSINSGVTWEDVTPPEYRKGDTLIQANSTDCGYVPPTPSRAKFLAAYSFSRTYSAECDSNTTLTSGNTRPSGYDISYMISVEIGDCVTKLGKQSFMNASALSSVTIGSGVTTIDEWAFIWSGLHSVTIPNNVTTLNRECFKGCNSLTSVTIGNGVTAMTNGAFSNCANLKTLVADAVTIGFRAFSNCNSLTSVTFGSHVRTIGENAFSSMSALTEVTIPSGVTNIGTGAFASCIGLTSVTIGNGVTTIGENAFSYNPNIKTITIGSGVTSIGYGAFQNCSGLISVTITATTPPTLTGGSVFFSTNNCPIYVPSGSVSAYKAANRWSSYSSRIQAIPNS